MKHNNNNKKGMEFEDPTSDSSPSQVCKLGLRPSES